MFIFTLQAASPRCWMSVDRRVTRDFLFWTFFLWIWLVGVMHHARSSPLTALVGNQVYNRIRPNMSQRSSLTPDFNCRLPPPPSSTAFTRKSVDMSSTKDGRNARSHSAVGGAVCGNLRPQTDLTVVMLGSSKVGKSALINQFLHGVFREEYKETVDDMHWIEYDASSLGSSPSTLSVHASYPKQPPRQDLPAGIFLLKIIDSSGSHEFIGMRKLYEQQGDAFVLVVAIDDQNSLEEAKVIRREIGEQNQKNAPVIVVLNKIDLRSKSEERCWPDFRVMADLTKEFATFTGSLYIEATATAYESVADVFQRLLQHHSSVPPTTELKYRRKSVPAITMENMAGVQFTPLNQIALKRQALPNATPNMHRRRGNTFSDHKKEQDVMEEEREPKRPSCVIS